MKKSKKGLKTNYGKTHRKIEENKIKAMQYARKIGRILASQHPEIIDDLRENMTYLEIADKYNVSYETASTGVNIICNCAEKLVEDGVIGREEFDRLRRQRHKEFSRRAGKKVGPITFKKKIGCFSLTPEERSKLNKDIGRNMGKYGKINYKYLANMSEKDKILSRIRASAARGAIAYDIIRLELPWGYMNEKEYIIYLKEEKELSWKGIESRVNRIFGNGRNYAAIRTSYNSNWRSG